jgi:nitroreductase
MKQRKAAYPIIPLILNRWSSRAISDEPLDEGQIQSLFEAARWAPSSYNTQPWRFIYGRRGTKQFDKLFALLVPFNQSWAHTAALLVLVISRNRSIYNNEPARTHSFDTGAACENLALQGHFMGLVVHCMEGFDYDKARQEFTIPDNYTVEAMLAIGKPGNIHNLPIDLQKREIPSDRNPIEQFVYEGIFKE